MSSLLDFCDDHNDDRTEGERLRDEALGMLRSHRPRLIRQLQRAFLQHLLANGDDTSDPVRSMVEIPVGIDPRVVGGAVRGLAERSIITSVGRRPTRRAIAHARKLDVWAIKDEAAARHWLLTHADQDSESSADPTDPYAP
ncbi:MAG: hypothetical protein K8U57_39660 [Planctomycetes bacterium]|nr:hypothetical protein [Planctomycetota bacterium]